MTYSNGFGISTYDRDNDYIWYRNCALERIEAWWYVNCSLVVPTGVHVYLPGSVVNQTGINWMNTPRYSVYYSDKATAMTLIPR